MSEIVRIDRDERGVATVALDRPEVRNAFDPALMGAIRDGLRELAASPDVRCVVLRGEGKTFSAGADLTWMSSMRDNSFEDNVADSREMDALFRELDRFPRPVVARVQGAALGGGMGLIACADIVVAARDAVFGFSEAKLGIAPAVISTYVIPRLGVGQARRYFLTGERFHAERAFHLGLVHEVCEPEELDGCVDRIVAELLSAGPGAQARMKPLIRDVAAAPDQDAAAEITTRTIAELRVSDEGQEGMAAFFERRPPAWSPRAPDD